MKHNRYIDVVQSATGSPYRPGNHIDILENGDEIFAAMLEAIQGAKHTIEFATYVYWHSRVATQFANSLCERARAGVRVRLLVDAVGAAIMSSRTVWQLERAGVEVAWFRPMRWPHLRNLNHRTHRKILLIDGGLGFTGGVGIADEWAGSAHTPRHWRETHCRLRGPACADLLAGFAENWYESTGERLTRPVPPPVAGEVAVHTTISTATVRPTSMEQLVEVIIHTAQSRLWITTAYFVPAPQYVAALVAAVARGVDVRVLTNGARSNHKVTRWAGQASYEALLRGGVKIYEYQPTVLHAKVISADASWATLGSTNLDERSLALNDELNISFTDASLVAQLDSSFEANLACSKLVELDDWLARSLPVRLLTRGASVFASQL